MSHDNYLVPVDYVVMAFILTVPVLIGAYYGFFRKQSAQDLLTGDKRMSTLPVAVSIMVTFFSAVNILGYPAEIYRYGIQIFMLSVVAGIFTPLSALLFVPVLYNLKLTSSFEYLEHRFRCRPLRQVSATMFILYCAIVQSVIIYAPSIALQTMLGVPTWMSVVVVGLVCTIYTAMGGFKAVIWTDFFQFLVLMTGMCAITFRAMSSSNGPLQTWKIAMENGRLNFFDFTIDPFERHNTFNFVIGFGLKTLLTMGTHQNQVQRYSSVATEKQAINSIILSVPFNLLCNLLIGATGLSIYTVYANCDPIKQGIISKPDQIVPYFVIEHFAHIPGLLGLFLSCVFCAVLSTFSSGLNCMTAVLWQDFLIDRPCCRNLKPATKANLSRLISFLFGVFCIGLAFLGPKLGPILTVSLSAIGAFAGPMASTFVLGIFVPLANKYGALVGLPVGLLTTFFFVIQAFLLPKAATNRFALPTSVEGCQSAISNGTAVLPSLLASEQIAIEWPQRLFTLSYLLYPTLGAIVTLSSGIAVSLFTGGLRDAKLVRSIYIHPWLRSGPSKSEAIKLEMAVAAGVRSAEGDLEPMLAHA